MIEKTKRNSFAVLIVIFLAALSARLLKLILDPMLLRDSALYLYLAEIWKETGDYGEVISTKAITPPLHLFLVVKLMDCNLDAEIAGRGIALFLGAMLPVLGYLIARKVFNDKLTASIAALLLILHPTLVSYSIQPIRENSYLFFLGLTIIEIINGIQYGRRKDWGMCGVFVSLAFYCRYEALELFLFCPFILFYLYFREKIDRERLISTLSIFFAVVFATCFLLLSIINYDISFISKISKYSDKAIEQFDVRDFIQNDSQILE